MRCAWISISVTSRATLWQDANWRSTTRRTTSSRSAYAATRRPTRCSSNSSMRAARTSGGSIVPTSTFRANGSQVRFKKRHIEFAWGPLRDRTLRHSAALELVVARGQGGGKGTVCFDRLSFRELPTDQSSPPTPVARASSTLGQNGPAHALDGTVRYGLAQRPRNGEGADVHGGFPASARIRRPGSPLAA